MGVNHSVESLQIVLEERLRRPVPIESAELLFERIACHCFERDTEMVECEDVEVAPAHGLASEALTITEEERQECLYGLISGECPIQGASIDTIKTAVRSTIAAATTASSSTQCSYCCIPATLTSQIACDLSAAASSLILMLAARGVL